MDSDLPEKKTPQEMSHKEICAQVFRDTIGNAIWFGVGALVVVGVGLVLPFVAKILFGIYAIIAVIDLLWVAITVVIPTIILAVAHAFRVRAIEHERHEAGWALLSTLIRLIDVAVGLAFGWYMYIRLF